MTPRPYKEDIITDLCTKDITEEKQKEIEKEFTRLSHILCPERVISSSSSFISYIEKNLIENVLHDDNGRIFIDPIYSVSHGKNNKITENYRRFVENGQDELYQVRLYQKEGCWEKGNKLYHFDVEEEIRKKREEEEIYVDIQVFDKIKVFCTEAARGVYCNDWIQQSQTGIECHVRRTKK